MLHHPVLDQLAGAGIRLGLDRVRSFLQFLGEPHRSYPVVHVAGTNGKGSVCAMVTEALVAAGYQVGTTLSPHVEAYNERVQLQGVPVDDATLVAAIESLDRARWDWAESTGFEGVPLTYFEFATCLAFRLFAERQVDVAVVEVGLGGRLDATNVVRPVVSAVTHVGLDHAETLGETLAEIAAEKAAIIKRGAPVVVGGMPAEAREVVEARARVLGVPAWIPGRDLAREQRRDGAWNLRTPEGTVSGVRLALAGLHQGGNASVAAGVLHALRRQGFYVPDEAIVEGLSRATLPARLEELLPGLVVDGAHNREGTEALADWLGRRPRPPSRILLWGMGEARDPVRTIEPLLPHVDEVVTTRCAHPHARDPMDLAVALQDLEILLAAAGPVEEALPEVYREAHETVVAGSLFVAGAARTLVREGLLDGIEPGQGRSEEP